MKISISYMPSDAEELRKVNIIRAFLEGLLPGVKVRISHRYDPFLHVYLTTKKPENPCKSKENP